MTTQQWLFEPEDDDLDTATRTSMGASFYAMTEAEIAQELGCSDRQVRAELRIIFRKLRRLARHDPEFRMHVRSVLGRVP